MRSFECTLSTEARLALIEAVLEEGTGLWIQRRTDAEHIVCEDWRLGSRMRGELLDMHFDPTVQAWRTFFGFGSSAKMIAQIVSDRNDCSWIWPAGGLTVEDMTS
jgi:hypothetical protein